MSVFLGLGESMLHASHAVITAANLDLPADSTLDDIELAVIDRTREMYSDVLIKYADLLESLKNSGKEWKVKYLKRAALAALLLPAARTAHGRTDALLLPHARLPPSRLTTPPPSRASPRCFPALAPNLAKRLALGLWRLARSGAWSGGDAWPRATLPTTQSAKRSAAPRGARPSLLSGPSHGAQHQKHHLHQKLIFKRSKPTVGT
eukprot:SAG11_NODE_385_length_9888_cov_13.326387_2_plen_206_part_00